MQQTTVLIAHLSTAAGLRAPLAHVADQVFLELSREIEAQGVSRKVAADMFGMALRSYQRKVGRLAESVTDKKRTLWEAVHDFIRDEGRVTRPRVLQRFRYDGEPQVGAVLNDLVGSGLVTRIGHDIGAVYRPTDDEDYAEFVQQDRGEALPWLLWVSIYRAGGIKRDALQESLSVDATEFDAAIAELVSEGRVTVESVEGETFLTTGTFLVPVGSEAGWEAAVFDHFQALCTAVSCKLQTGAAKSLPDDVVGGATLSFDVYPGHPFEEQVYGTLARVRGDVNVLWRAVSEYNKANPPPDAARKVSFYFGQAVEGADEEGPS